MTTNDAVKEQKDVRSSNRLLLIILCGVLILTLSVFLFTSSKNVKTWNIASPQGVVQAYIKAMTAGNTDMAAKFLTNESKCTIADLDRAFVSPEIRVYLKSARIVGNSASVSVRVETQGGTLFDNNYSELHTLRLTQTRGNWFLTGIPWPIYDCGVIQK